MTRVEFHTSIADPLDFACRLLRKACRQGVRVQVSAAPETLTALDRALWTEPERDFVPHLRMPGGRAEVAARTPIWLVPHDLGPPAPRVLINVGAAAPAQPQALERLIEIVAAEPEEAARGRERYRAYKQGGLDVVHHAAHAAG
ncbi:MAG: DNA polymerase III subunit chi [Rubrivivax sp.]|nr:DNA polymerase III subunit chi [Rubrivivax sp.]